MEDEIGDLYLKTDGSRLFIKPIGDSVLVQLDYYEQEQLRDFLIEQVGLPVDCDESYYETNQRG
jgi:hypothetical protein